MFHRAKNTVPIKSKINKKKREQTYLYIQQFLINLSLTTFSLELMN